MNSNEVEVKTLARVLAPVLFVLSIIAIIYGNYVYFFQPWRRGGVTASEWIIVNLCFMLGLYISIYFYKKVWKNPN